MQRTTWVLGAVVLALVALVSGQEPNAQEGESKPDTKGVKINKIGRVADGHLIVVHTAGGVASLDVYDPVARKEVANLAKFPQGVGVDHVAISPDRKRVAFASQLNNQMSLISWNIFVIECESGALNQLTPDEATNEGLAKPRTGTGRANIKGKLVWFDEERGGKSSHFIHGNVRIDGIEELAILKGDGTFVIENVPASEPFSSYLVYARAMLPRTSKQEMTTAQGSLAVTVKPGETKDIGEISVSPPRVDLAFGYPTWHKDGLFVSGISNGYCAYAGYPKLKRDGWQKSFLDWTFIDPCGVMASPDGKYLAGADKWSNNSVEDYKTARSILFFDSKTGKPVKRVDLGDPGTLWISSNNHGAWLPDSSAVLIPGWYSNYSGEESITMAPCLYGATPSGEGMLVKVFKEAAGKGNITCVSPDATGKIIYVLFAQNLENGGTSNDLWAWNRETDETAQITQVGDILSFAGYGR